jgi:dephospho-CoA kinase
VPHRQGYNAPVPPPSRPWPPGIRVIGLTGGIASGKSTVAGTLRGLGAQVIDADVLAREVVAPGTPGLRAVATRFPGVLCPDGALDREALGARVFADPAERAALNALLHPLIQAAFAARVDALARRGERVVVYDAPLIVENGLHVLLDGLIVVALPPELQIARLRARSGLSEEAARARIAAQLPLEDKLRHATWVVDNAGSPEHTLAQVRRIWEALCG